MGRTVPTFVQLIQQAAERWGKFRRASRREDQPHFDAKEGIITLPAELTKTGRSRLVPLHADLKLKTSKPNQPVFPLVNFRWAWYKARIAVGAGRWETMATGRERYVGLLPRNCRHMFVRNASDAGLEERRIMDIAGHRPRSTFDRDNIGKKKERGRATVRWGPRSLSQGEGATPITNYNQCHVNDRNR